MAEVVCLTFNPFEENTYLLYDDTKECIIFDPGCYDQAEKNELANTIQRLELKPVRLINTHCHLDHIFGNRFVTEKYGLSLEIHSGEIPVLERAPQAAMLYGVSYPELSPAPGGFIEEADIIEFGNTKLEAILTPGHSPASLCFFCKEHNFLIAGDVLFYGSIGRTDLPGGDYDTLIESITQKLLPLGDGVQVYPGHGFSTSIGFERLHNPFL
ncbi:MAG: MBL fold metallo-hydrolase [Saprospiraceae bacterium]|nr:MBL fold metallo-hydrolase [Saprospiraceae bacterium]